MKTFVLFAFAALASAPLAHADLAAEYGARSNAAYARKQAGREAHAWAAAKAAVARKGRVVQTENVNAGWDGDSYQITFYARLANGQVCYVHTSYVPVPLVGESGPFSEVDCH